MALCKGLNLKAIRKMEYRTPNKGTIKNKINPNKIIYDSELLVKINELNAGNDHDAMLLGSIYPIYSHPNKPYLFNIS